MRPISRAVPYILSLVPSWWGRGAMAAAAALIALPDQAQAQAQSPAQKAAVQAAAQAAAQAATDAAAASSAAATARVRAGDVLTPEDWARLRGGSLTSPGAQGSEIFGKLAPSIVYVYTVGKARGGKPGPRSSGTGSIVSTDGLILTNNHVIDDAESVYVALYPPGGRRELTPEDLHEARVLRYDEVADLALVKMVKPPEGLRPLPFGDFSALKVGEEVHAIGHPLGNTWTYTKGVVSQIRDGYRWTDSSGALRAASVIQTQTPISPGNSGGPLIDGNGRMVGVNTFGSANAQAQGLNYAVAVTEVERFLSTSGTRRAQRASDAKPQAQANCPNDKPRVLKEYRNSTGDHTFIDLDLDCDGQVDLTARIPDRADLAVRYTVERNGKTVMVFIDTTRTQKIDYSLHDTNGDGVPDQIGVHTDGEFKASRFVPYTGEASVRAVLQQQKK